MKKLKIIILSIILISTIIIGGFLAIKYDLLNNNTQNKKENIPNNSNTNQNIDNQTIKEDNTNKLEEKESTGLEKLKNEYAVKGLIISGDIHLENDDYILALKNYIEASKEEKSDFITEKIGDTYFLMKKWKEAYNYYSKIEDIAKETKEKLINSFLYSSDLTDNNSFSGTIEKFKTFNLDSQEYFYYTNSLYCLEDFHICKQNFNDFFDNEENIVTDEKLIRIKEAIENYRNFGLEELYYKNTLIVGAFMQNGFYPLAAILGEEVLKEKADYKPLLKIIAQSYYELNNIDDTKKYLNKYYEIEPKDKSVAYMLGIISQKQHDYLLSNIYLTKALKLGYEPKEDIYRIQIYNSYILNDTTKIITNFDNLINSQEKPEFNDLILATYYNLINGNTKKAIELTKMGISLYPDREDFYGFSGWIMLEQQKYELAKETLLKGYEINKQNPLINLNLGKVEKANGEKVKALIYFKRAQKLDNGGDISKIATNELNELEKEDNSNN